MRVVHLLVLLGLLCCGQTRTLTGSAQGSSILNQWASAAAGADAIMVEVHPEPDKAFSDGRQSMTPDAFGEMMKQLARVAQAVDRHIPGVTVCP